MSETFASAFDAASERWPDREALVIGDRRLSFSDAAEGSILLAAGWLELGVRPGDRVGIWLENSVDWALAFWSLSRIGAVVAPLSTRWTAPELRNVLEQAQLSALLIGDRFRKLDFLQLLEQATGNRHGGGAASLIVSVAAAPPAPIHSLESLSAGALDATSRQRVAAAQSLIMGDDVAVVQFTSGSTSFPKGAMLRQAAMIEYVKDYGALMGLTPDDRLLCHMPFFHIAGLNHILLVPAVLGATAITDEGFDAASALRQLRTEKCTAFGAISTIYLRMAEASDQPADDFANIRTAWIQGSPHNVRRVHEITGLHGLTAHYGATEMSGATTFGDVRDPLEKRLANCGRPMPGVETRIVDVETGALAAAGETGEVWHRGSRIMAGYLGLGPEHWNIDRDGWLHTGDLGRIDDEGYLTFEGRLKDMLKVGGENVACAEVEEALMSHAAVKLAAVVGVPDPLLEEIPVAFVEARGDADAIVEILSDHCARAIAKYKMPRRIFVVSSLPMTASNKIHKPALRQMAMERLGVGASDLKPNVREGA